MPHEPSFVPFSTGNTEDELGLGGLDPRLTRTNYFDGRLLKASDLVRDQLYLDERLRETGRALGSGVARGLHASLDEETIRVTPGVGIASSGRVLELGSPLSVDLGDRAQITILNQGSVRRFNRGLYVVALQLAERGVDAAEVYPQDPSANREFQFNAYEEGVELVLVPLPTPLPRLDALHARAELGRTLLRNPHQPVQVTDDALALGVLAVERDRLVWLDRRLVYRDLETAHSDDALKHNLLAHYRELFSEVMAARGAASLGGDFPASSYFSWVPPCGPLPKAAIDPVTGRQGYFPDSYRVSIAPIRLDDLEQVETECLTLDPLDLAADEGAEVLVLAPLSDADFTWHARRLERSGELLPARALPFIDPLRLRFRPLASPHRLDTDEAVWREIWDRVPAEQLRYVRRPARVAETRVSAVVLARGFNLPPPGEVLPEVAELTTQLNEARNANTALQSQLSNANAQLSQLRARVEGLLREIEELSRGEGGTPLTTILDLRANTPQLREMATRVVDGLREDPTATKQLVAVLSATPALYDDALWPTLMQVVRAGQLPDLLRVVQKATSAGVPVPEVVLDQRDALRLTDAMVEAWKIALERGPRG